MYHSTPTSAPPNNSLSTGDIDGGLPSDFDGSLPGLGTELGTASCNMSEAKALPVFKQENLENGFQYILGAATSPAVKINKETLTYLNQDQTYEIKLTKLGDHSELQGEYLRSLVKVLFGDRQRPFREEEQIDSWKKMRPKERILDIDIPLSYGLNVNLDTVPLNQLEFIWDPTKATGLYVLLHCISTEFTAKKQEVPLRIQVETYDEAKLLHAASCQIKVFKDRGADRKHKTDREKMEKKSDLEKENYQPSYECTVLTEVPKDQIIQSKSGFSNTQSLTSSFAELNCTASPNPSLSPPQSSTIHTPMPFTHSQPVEPLDVLAGPLLSNAQAIDVARWLHFHRFSNYVRVFQNFSGADLLRLTREDLIQLCGLVDGIRLARNIRPRLTVYICQEPESNKFYDKIYHAIYLDTLGLAEFKMKLSTLFGIQTQQISDILMQGPSQIHILLTDEVVQNIQDQTRFVVEGMKDEHGDQYKILLKTLDQ